MVSASTTARPAVVQSPKNQVEERPSRQSGTKRVPLSSEMMSTDQMRREIIWPLTRSVPLLTLEDCRIEATRSGGQSRQKLLDAKMGDVKAFYRLVD